MTTIRTTAVANTTDLYQRYPAQGDRQPCYVQLDCETGELSADWDGEIGNGVPESVWHRIVLRWTVPVLTADAANALMAKIAPIAERVLAGYSNEWDGSNHVGRYDEDACDEIDRIRDLCGDSAHAGDEIQVWEAGDYCDGSGDDVSTAESIGITADSTDEDLARIATGIESEALIEGIHVIEGLSEYLDGLRDAMAEVL